MGVVRYLSGGHRWFSDQTFSEPVVLLIAVAASMVVIGNLGDGTIKSSSVLSGYASGTTWLVFSAFQCRFCHYRLR
jgi:di/tricarboxylate transporter